MASTRKPFPQERIRDAHFRELVDSLCTRTGMHVNPPNVESVLTFIQGYCYAQTGGPLTGFAQWLVVRQNGGNNLFWTGHAKMALAEMDADPPDHDTDPDLSKLNALFTEFFNYRDENGTTKIFDDYAKWLRRQTWYDGPLSS